MIQEKSSTATPFLKKKCSPSLKSVLYIQLHWFFLFSLSSSGSLSASLCLKERRGERRQIHSTNTFYSSDLTDSWAIDTKSFLVFKNLFALENLLVLLMSYK